MKNLSNNSVLVTGGAGYIGSHTVRLLNANNYHVIVLDNLIYGHKEAIVDKEVTFIKGDIGNKDLLEKIFKDHNIKAVMHFAAYTYVGESVTNPSKYYHNNTATPLILLDAMVKYNCLNFIFSSTCATYGNPLYTPLDEMHPQNPINPYGRSKLMLEHIIKDYEKAYGIKYSFLRYFNACGSWEDAVIGEDHNPETHLIPVVLSAIKGEVESITVFGTDYDTPDGTCIRDYIHVVDLAKAHLLALKHLLKRGTSIACNLGTGKGTSVKEIITAAEKVTGKKVPVKYGTRREGDPAQLVANPSYAKLILGWEADHKEISKIILSAWQWANGPKQGKY
jgi:UDP-glucose 4-epimerase